jgi:hypothetical protein
MFDFFYYRFTNERRADEVIDLITSHGFVLHEEWSMMLRLSARIRWYRRGALVFLRKGHAQIEGSTEQSREVSKVEL